MKKKLAMLLAGVMALSMVPMTAFAKSTNRVTNVAVAKVDTVLGVDKDAPSLVLKGDDFDGTTEAFKLTLTNAEWDQDGDFSALDGTIDFITDSIAVVEAAPADGESLYVPMNVELTAKGDATVTVDPRESTLTAGEYKFATVTGGAVAVSTLGVKSVAEKVGATTLKTIVLEELVSGSIDDTEQLKLRLSKGWEFVNTGALVWDVYPAGAATLAVDATETDGRDLVLDVTVVDATEAIILTLKPQVKWDAKKVDAGDICEVIVSGAVDKTTLDVAKAITYGYSFEAEDKAVPEIYWGRTDETLDATFAETIAESWLDGRYTEIVFNEEVEVTAWTETVNDGFATNGAILVQTDENEFEFTGDWTRNGNAVDIDFGFTVAVKPGYTGDITATLSGKGVEGEEFTVVLATAIAPVTFEVEKSDVVIDYRHTAIGDIIITEAEAGILEDGTAFAFQIERLSFDDEPEVEVVAGDIEIDDIYVNGGYMVVVVEEESVKEAATIKITGATLYMERQIPAGDFFLKLVPAIGKDADADTAAVNGEALYLNLTEWDNKVTLASDYVSVVTAGRDVDETFTTTLVVTAGATEMKANDKVIALDVPAYITNDGRMMLPVRAVIEALSGAAIVAWDDTAKQITISTGSRVVAMTVGSDVMYINGVAVPMVKACEIVDSRAFVPVRDLGYALGLNDAAINYDAATSTATLN